MKVSRAYRVELDPNDVQRTALLRHAGAARWAYNWGLRRKIDAYRETGKSPSAIDLHRELNVLKKVPKEEGGCPWAYETSKCAMQEALRDLDRAFANFYRRCREKKAGRKGFPRFKSRKRGIGGFRLTGTIWASKTSVQLPRIGSIRLKEAGYLPTSERKGVRVLSASVTERAGHWFVALSVEEDRSNPPTPDDRVLGVDVGVLNLATLSDGTVFENPRALKGAEDRLKRLQRSVSRKVKGSNNRRKAVQRLARQHYRVSNIRRDAIHKATSTAIAKRPAAIGIETLNVSGMMGNHNLAKALSDASMAEFLRQIGYKATWAGIPVFRANRWYPSSRRCSVCGLVKDRLDLGEREFACEGCGVVEDRDLNAALNLEEVAREGLAASSAVTACGAESAGRGPSIPTKLPAMKQEPSTGTRTPCPCLG